MTGKMFLIVVVAMIQIVQATVMMDMMGEFKRLRARIDAIEASPYVVPPSHGRGKRKEENLRRLPFSKPPTSEKIAS